MHPLWREKPLSLSVLLSYYPYFDTLLAAQYFSLLASIKRSQARFDDSFQEKNLSLPEQMVYKPSTPMLTSQQESNYIYLGKYPPLNPRNPNNAQNVMYYDGHDGYGSHGGECPCYQQSKQYYSLFTFNTILFSNNVPLFLTLITTSKNSLFVQVIRVPSTIPFFYNTRVFTFDSTAYLVTSVVSFIHQLGDFVCQQTFDLLFELTNEKRGYDLLRRSFLT